MYFYNQNFQFDFGRLFSVVLICISAMAAVVVAAFLKLIFFILFCVRYENEFYFYWNWAKQTINPNNSISLILAICAVYHKCADERGIHLFYDTITINKWINKYYVGKT